MPFKTLAHQEHAKQILKEADADGALLHGFYGNMRTHNGKQRYVGCAVGHMWNATNKFGRFGLADKEMDDIERAFEGWGPMEEAAGWRKGRCTVLERVLQVIDEIGVA